MNRASSSAMSVAAVMMVKDEADVIEFTIQWLLSQVEEVIVSDNGSTDGTLEILDGFTGTDRVRILRDERVGYYQAEKMSALAEQARYRGHDWVIPVDADEFWRTPDIETTLTEALGALDPDIYFTTAALYDHKATPHDPPQAEAPDPRRRLGFRFREPSKLPKVACRCTVGLQIAMGNHSAVVVGGNVPAVSSTGCPPTLPLLVVEHYPWRSEEQFVSKIRNGARAYAATDLPEEFGAHWRAFGDPDSDPTFEERVRAWYREWAYSEVPELDADILYSPFPFPAATGTWG